MYTLPSLTYAYDALEPYIDARTMEIHHMRHHQAYIDQLNAALAQHPTYARHSLEDLLSNLSSLPDTLRTAVQNHGGGHYNHTLFWEFMSPRSSQQPREKLAAAIVKTFGSFEKFQEQFNAAARTRFGSGWAWLCLNPAGDLAVISTANQDTPLALNCRPILGLDVWEHAYYLKYQNKRVDYIQAWWHVVNWDRAEDLFRG